MPRAQKQKYRFAEKRHGDQMTVKTEQARRYVMSAFANWKRGKPGSLTASSRKIGDEFVVTFSGVSPAEVGGDI